MANRSKQKSQRRMQIVMAVFAILVVCSMLASSMSMFVPPTTPHHEHSTANATNGHLYHPRAVTENLPESVTLREVSLYSRPHNNNSSAITSTTPNSINTRRLMRSMRYCPANPTSA